MEEKKKLLSFTNIFIFACIIVYILNIFVVSPSTGSVSKLVAETCKEQNLELDRVRILGFQILGTWGGHVNDKLCFSMDLFLKGDFWRVFTVALTHGHLPHIAMNMLALFMVGNQLEKKLGTLRVSIFFILTTCIVSIVMGLFVPSVASTGASGGIFGLIGISLILNFYTKDFIKNYFSKSDKKYLIFYILFTSCLTGSLWTFCAHSVGCISGCILGLLVLRSFKIQSSDENKSKE